MWRHNKRSLVLSNYLIRNEFAPHEGNVCGRAHTAATASRLNTLTKRSRIFYDSSRSCQASSVSGISLRRLRIGTYLLPSPRGKFCAASQNHVRRRLAAQSAFGFGWMSSLEFKLSSRHMQAIHDFSDFFPRASRLFRRHSDDTNKEIHRYRMPKINEYSILNSILFEFHSFARFRHSGCVISLFSQCDINEW